MRPLGLASGLSMATTTTTAAAAHWLPLVSVLVTLMVTLQNNQWGPALVLCRPNVAGPETSPTEGQKSILRSLTPPREAAECAVFQEYGRNYITPVDLLVKNSETNTVCIRARFAISIRVEEAHAPGPAGNQSQHEHAQRPILGYVPLEHVLMVEESCPDRLKKGQVGAGDAEAPKEASDQGAGGGDQEGGEINEAAPKASGADSGANDEISPRTGQATESTAAAVNSENREARQVDKLDQEKEEDEDELELIVTFECGKLSFTFKRDKSKIYVSAIRGMVKIDKKVVREFIAIRPMFLTSDLDHYFKHDDEIEVVSEVQSGVHVLTAIFHFTEIEAFRESASRDFIKPPDEKSKPFPDDSPEQNGEAQAGEPQSTKQATT